MEIRFLISDLIGLKLKLCDFDFRKQKLTQHRKSLPIASGMRAELDSLKFSYYMLVVCVYI